VLNPKAAIIPIHKDSESDFLSLDIADDLKDKVISGSCCLSGIDFDIN
jgi:hypothetical protein